MKRTLALTLMAVLALGLIGTGCTQKVAREANVAAGDYYTTDEFSRLGKEQRDAYCADLSSELERLNAEKRRADDSVDSGESVDLRTEKARVQSQIRAQERRVGGIEDEIDYYESLPSSYTVVRGDCLWRISGREQIYADPLKWPRLYRANRDQLDDPDLIYPRQVLAVPRDWPDQHTVVRGEWLSKIAGYWEIFDDHKRWPELYEANRDMIDDPDLIFPDQVLDVPR